MRRFSYVEFEEQTDEIFALAEAGETVILTREGRDIFRLEPVALETYPSNASEDL